MLLEAGVNVFVGWPVCWPVLLVVPFSSIREGLGLEVMQG